MTLNKKGSGEISMFLVVFMILFVLNISLPYFSQAMGDTTSTTNSDTELTDGFSYTQLLGIIPGMLFWTFGVNSWINIFLLTPLRVLMGITLYYIIIPTK